MSIYDNMDFEDSRNALFVEPNAFLPKFEVRAESVKPIKKVQYQQPYENAPNPANFLNSTSKTSNSNNMMARGNNFSNFMPEKQMQSPQQNAGFGFDGKSLMSLLGALGKGKNDIMGILNLLGNQSKGVKANGTANPILNFISNPDILNMLGSLIKGSQTKMKEKKGTSEISSTDYEIKKYTRV